MKLQITWKRYMAIMFAMCMLIASCTKDGEDGSIKKDPAETGGPDEVPSNNNSAFFAYKIDNGNSVRVDCSHLKFDDNGETMSSYLATSASTRSTFNFSFPSTVLGMDTLKVGKFPYATYSGWLESHSTFTLSVKAPLTVGGTDYYLSIFDKNNSSKYFNEITKIQKGGLEEGKRVYFISGKYLMYAKNLNAKVGEISGSYLFKVRVRP